MIEFRDLREQKSTIGVNNAELDALVTHFDSVLTERTSQQSRQRKFGAGRRGQLPQSGDKVIFCLYYLKNYPTFDVLGNRFGLSRSSAHEALHKWLPFVKAALEKIDVLPIAEFASPEAMQKHFEKKH